MNVTLRQLEVFTLVAKHLNFTRASQLLHMTQPAVSMQIKQLEENLGIPLFEKMGKQIFLTEAGREMYQYANRIAREVLEATEVIEDLKGSKRGHLRIAVASTANYFATRLLGIFCQQHFPGSTFNLEVTNRATLLNLLSNNETDVVIMGKPPIDYPVMAQMFLENPLVVIAHPDHPLVKKRNIPLQRLEQEKFVVREIGSGTRNAMEYFFRERDVHLVTGMEMNSNEAIKHAVEAELGLGIVSIHTLELELETKRLAVLNVEQFPILRHWYLIHRNDKRLTPIAQAFEDFVISHAPKIVLGATAPKLGKKSVKRL